MQNNVPKADCYRATTTFVRLATAGWVIASFFFMGNGATFAQKNEKKASRQLSPACHTPQVGSAERKAILDTLRVSVEEDAETRVKFVIDDPKINFRVAGDWCFVFAQFVQSNGSPMGKKYYDAIGDGGSDVQAFLHRVKGKWKVVTHVTGATDVEWLDWAKTYHAPATVLPPMN